VSDLSRVGAIGLGGRRRVRGLSDPSFPSVLMPSPRNRSWTESEAATLRRLRAEGAPVTEIARAIGRAVGSVTNYCQRFDVTAPKNKVAERSVNRQQEVSDRLDGDCRELRADGRKIKTVEDLIRHIGADMTQFVVAASEASKYEGIARDPDGKIRTHEMFRVFVRLKPKPGPTVVEAVEAMLTAAFRTAKAPAVRTVPKSRSDIWQFTAIADPHFGDKSWPGSTNGPAYDLDIARRCVAMAAAELIALGHEIYRPARRTIGFLGDVFHYDTVGGTTTGGTPLERDGRYQKMIDIGVTTCIEVIEQSAATCPTDVVVVAGNHDKMLSATFQRILQERFRRDARVTIDATHTSRKYLRFGETLLGVTHGDKAKRKLPQLMALEAKRDWGETSYREIHTGHLHHQAAEWQRPIETIDGVVVRIAPSLKPADDWHAEQGFLGAPRGMETFFYRKTGGLAGMIMSSPDFPASRAKAA